MPTTYIGDPTQTRSPALKPGPGGVPSLALPNDGEAANAASIAQALKVLADFMGFVLTPTATPTEWAEALQRFRSAAGHTRFAIDHLGFPGGSWTGWDEGWPATYSKHNTGLDVTRQTTTWDVEIVQATPNDGVEKVFIGDGVTLGGGRFRYAQLCTGGDTNDYTVLSTAILARLLPELHLVAEANVALFSTTGVANYFALCGVPFVASGGSLVGPTDNYVAFKRPAAGGNWRAVTRAMGGSEVVTDTGVAVVDGEWHRMRIEWHGATVADDSAEAVRFLIDDALVAEHLAPGVDHGLSEAWSFFASHNSGGTPLSGNPLVIGPARYRANVYSTDVL